MGTCTRMVILEQALRSACLSFFGSEFDFIYKGVVVTHKDRQLCIPVCFAYILLNQICFSFFYSFQKTVAMVIADVNQVNQTGNECYQSHLVAEAADTCLLSSAAVVCNVDTRLMEITDANTPEVDVTRASSPSAANMLCTQCGKEFYTRQELFQHVKIAHQQHAHAARRMFKCEQCMKSFKTMVSALELGCQIA